MGARVFSRLVSGVGHVSAVTRRSEAKYSVRRALEKTSGTQGMCYLGLLLSSRAMWEDYESFRFYSRTNMILMLWEKKKRFYKEIGKFSLKITEKKWLRNTG